MAEVVEIIKITPGKITFTFKGETYNMGGEGSFVKMPGIPDYSVATSSVVNTKNPDRMIRFEGSDLKIITDQLRQGLASRGMTSEFLP